MNGPVAWFGAIGAILASAILAGDFGRRASGWAFVLFMAVSVAWIASGVGSRTWPLVIQNAILLGIDTWGAWQFLLNPHKKKVIERQEELAEEAETEVSAEEALA
ncbi:MAG: hypothetical protein KGM17_01960 [Sphingomonadales bacterium]|nr:hypothetical protein [Sphingomonadales bacterium]